MPLLSRKAFAKPAKIQGKDTKLSQLTRKDENLVKARADFVHCVADSSPFEKANTSSKDTFILSGSNSINLCDSSVGLNDPAIKDAYHKFSQKVNQSPKEIDEISPPLFSQDDLGIVEEILNQSGDTGANVSRGVFELESPFSQEVLNRQVVKQAYMKHCSDVLVDEDYDFMKNFKFKRTNLKKPVTHTKKQSKKKYQPERNISFELKRKVKQNTKNLKHDCILFERMSQIQESRDVGLYVLCDTCDKARYMPHIKDPLDLPDKWYCFMNPDKDHNQCSDPEVFEEDEEDLIENKFNAGSIVWAKMEGYPWWPAMVDDDPDYEVYFWLEGSITPTQYHVTFFDSQKVTRVWLLTEFIKPLQPNISNPHYLPPTKCSVFKSRINYALKEAQAALNMPLIDRLRKYSFVTRYPHPLKNRRKKVCSEETLKKRNSEKNRRGGTSIKKRTPSKLGSKKKEKKRFRRIITSFSTLSDGNVSEMLDRNGYDVPNFEFNLFD